MWKTRAFCSSRIMISIVAIVTTGLVLTAGCSGEPGDDTAEETEAREADISLTEVTVDSEEILVGQRLTVDVELTNSGTGEGQQQLILEVDETEVATMTATVPAPVAHIGEDRATATASLSWTPEDPGEYEIAVNGDHHQSVTVDEAEMDVVVTSVTIESGSETDVVVGDLVTVVADVENNGNIGGAVDLDLAVDGEVVQTETVDIAARDAQFGDDALSVEFPWVAEEAGTYDVSVNDVDADPLVVMGPPAVEIIAPASSELRYVEEGNGEGGEPSSAWYLEVDLEGQAMDPVEDELTDESLEWTTTADVDGNGEVEIIELGTGSDLTAKLWVEDDECGAVVNHHLKLTATNSSGLTETAVRVVPVQMVKC